MALPLLFCLGGCSLIVDGIDGVAACEIVDGQDPCPEGQMCVDGQCRSVQATCEAAGMTCGPGERCDTTFEPPACVPTTCTVGSCPSPTVCDLETGDCIAPRVNGDSCLLDNQCLSGICASSAAVKLDDVVDVPAQVCTAACCTDADCGDGELCWPSSTGAKVCLPASLLNRTRGSVPVGGDCQESSECESGLCYANVGICLGNCNRSSDCPGSCGLVPINRRGQAEGSLEEGFWARVCLTAGNGGELGASCYDDNECASAWCAGESLFSPGECQSLCGATADCTEGGYHCGYESGTGDDIAPDGRVTARTDYFAACLPSNHRGAGLTGDACTADEDCRDLACESGVCADVCCHNRDCPDGTLCRPTRSGPRYEMRCL